MNRMSPCFNIFSLPRSLFCDCAGCVPSCLFCVCEIFMHLSGDVLWGCSSGEHQPASFSLRLSFFFCLSLFYILYSVARHCPTMVPPSFLLAVSPSLCYTVEEQHHCALHPLFKRPSIFQDCLKIGCFTLTVQMQTHTIYSMSMYVIPTTHKLCL